MLSAHNSDDIREKFAQKADGTSNGTGSLTFIAEFDLDPDGHLRLTNNRQAHPRHRLATRR